MVRRKKNSPHLGGEWVGWANADLVHQNDFFYFPFQTILGTRILNRPAVCEVLARV